MVVKPYYVDNGSSYTDIFISKQGYGSILDIKTAFPGVGFP